MEKEILIIFYDKKIENIYDMLVWSPGTKRKQDKDV